MNTQWLMKLKWVTRAELEAAGFVAERAGRDQVEQVVPAAVRDGRVCLSCGARESGGALPCGH